MQNTSLSLVETFFIVTVLPLLIFKGSKQYFRYFLMLTLKDFYSTGLVFLVIPSQFLWISQLNLIFVPYISVQIQENH